MHYAPAKQARLTCLVLMRLFKNSYILYFFFGGEGVSGGASYNGLDIKKIYMNSDFRLSMKDHVETKTFANLPSLSVKVILSK